jgi:hypothetical protein
MKKTHEKPNISSKNIIHLLKELSFEKKSVQLMLVDDLNCRLR